MSYIRSSRAPCVVHPTGYKLEVRVWLHQLDVAVVLRRCFMATKIELALVFAECAFPTYVNASDIRSTIFAALPTAR